jgi:hypothetical protein
MATRAVCARTLPMAKARHMLWVLSADSLSFRGLQHTALKEEVALGHSSCSWLPGSPEVLLLLVVSCELKGDWC